MQCSSLKGILNPSTIIEAGLGQVKIMVLTAVQNIILTPCPEVEERRLMMNGFS